MNPETLIVIPARFASSRFPGKPLVDIGGKSMIQRVYEQCSKVEGCEVYVATDDPRIFKHVLEVGGKVVMTQADHHSGTSRVAEVARQFPHVDHVINVQGDEPFIAPEAIYQIKKLLQQQASIATLVKKEKRESELMSPHIVKVALGEGGRALYFSRSLIPYPRVTREEITYHRHIGLYGFQRSILLKLVELPKAKVEKWESLEQLRWLAHGYEILTDETETETIAVDTPADLEKILASLDELE